MKRKYADQLTGGSKDVNPQTMLMVTAVQPAADTDAVTATPLPIPRLPIKQGKSLVMEILDITFFSPNIGYLANTVTSMTICLTTNPNPGNTSRTLFRDPRTIAMWPRTWVAVATGNGTQFIEMDNSKVFDTTDEAGHGYLVATDNLYLIIVSTGTTVANEADCSISYRFKEVNLEEYIGIVQSQQ